MSSAISVHRTDTTTSKLTASHVFASMRKPKRPDRIAEKKRKMKRGGVGLAENGRTAKASGREAVGWRCATCGALITTIEDGWVEWLASEGEHGDTIVKGLRLVHRSYTRSETSHRAGCRYDFRLEFPNDKSIVEGLPLERFVGPDGLMLLLSFLALPEMPKDEVLELAKRVQIPGYEQVRELFHEGLHKEVVTPVIGDGYYLQSEIRTLFRWQGSD